MTATGPYVLQPAGATELSSNPLLRSVFIVAQTTPPLVALISSLYFHTNGHRRYPLSGPEFVLKSTMIRFQYDDT